MDGINLLAEARNAGLLVHSDGERLIVRGLKQYAALVARLLSSKAGILAALEGEALAEAKAEREAIQAIEREADQQNRQATAERAATRPAAYCPRCRVLRHYRDTAIHGGLSIRRDCLHCGGFIDFPKWSGTP